MIIPLLILFIGIEIIQTWFLIFEKKFLRGTKGIVLTELLELPLALYLIVRGDTLIILIVISATILHWLAIIILFIFLK